MATPRSSKLGGQSDWEFNCRKLYNTSLRLAATDSRTQSELPFRKHIFNEAAKLCSTFNLEIGMFSHEEMTASAYDTI